MPVVGMRASQLSHSASVAVWIMLLNFLCFSEATLISMPVLLLPTPTPAQYESVPLSRILLSDRICGQVTPVTAAFPQG